MQFALFSLHKNNQFGDEVRHTRATSLLFGIVSQCFMFPIFSCTSIKQYGLLCSPALGPEPMVMSWHALKAGGQEPSECHQHRSCAALHDLAELGTVMRQGWI